MNNKTKIGLEILQSAVLLGITGDLLLRQTPWGLNVFLWVALLVTAMVAITLRRKTEHWTVQTMALHGALLFFSLMFVWRDSMELKVLNFIAILTTLSLLVLPALKVKTHVTGVFQYGVSTIYAGMSATLAPFWLLFEDIKWNAIPKQGWSKHLISVVRGVAIAAPILFVFGALFMAADAVFEGIVENTFNIDADEVFTHALLIGFLSWIIAGYLRASMLDFADFGKAAAVPKPVKKVVKPSTSITAHVSKEPVKPLSQHHKESVIDRLEAVARSQEAAKEKDTANKQKKTKPWNWKRFDNSVLPEFFTLGIVETSIILGLINLLFFGFVLVQVPYLFGGMDLVQTTPDFKLAEYARRGFGELVAVSGLVLPILLLSHWLLRKDKPINETIFRVFAGIQIGLLFVIMISATQRMLLLTGDVGYGLTIVRFYPMAFMAFLALVFAWFGLTVLRGMRHQFAWGTLWIALFVLGTLHVMNPDDFIVRTNVGLMQQGRLFDAEYNSNLSDDAIPAVLESLESMTIFNGCVMKQNLNHRLKSANEETDFRSWNYSRWVARNELNRVSENFNMGSCLFLESDQADYEFYGK